MISVLELVAKMGRWDTKTLGEAYLNNSYIFGQEQTTQADLDHATLPVLGTSPRGTVQGYEKRGNISGVKGSGGGATSPSTPPTLYESLEALSEKRLERA